MFDCGNNAELTNHILNLFIESITAEVWVSHYPMLDSRLDRVTLNFRNQLVSSGGSRTIYIYKKKHYINPVRRLEICDLIRECFNVDMNETYEKFISSPPPPRAANTRVSGMSNK